MVILFKHTQKTAGNYIAAGKPAFRYCKNKKNSLTTLCWRRQLDKLSLNQAIIDLIYLRVCADKTLHRSQEAIIPRTVPSLCPLSFFHFYISLPRWEARQKRSSTESWSDDIELNSPFQVVQWYPSLMNYLSCFPNMQRVTNKQICTIPNRTHRFKGLVFATFSTESWQPWRRNLYKVHPPPARGGALR